jgi:phenylpropionate dioxygenase-like ring-hydroxylating dioxygenase large terminal subunit
MPDMSATADLDARLRAGYTFPSRWYWDPQIHRLELDVIWPAWWHYACGTDMLPFVRRNGELVFEVTAGPTGPVATCNGQPAAAEVFGGLVFVHADPGARSFRETYPALARLVVDHPFDREGYERAPGERDAAIDANWKIWVENSSECYHCPTIHKHSFSDVYDVAHDAYVYIDDGPVLCQLTEPAAGSGRFGHASQEYRYWYLFPSTFLQIDEHYASASVVYPTGPESCVTTGESWLRPGTSPEDAAAFGEMWRITGAEDVEAVAIQQPSMRCGLVPHGRLMPSSESAIAHFHRLCFEALRPHLG